MREIVVVKLYPNNNVPMCRCANVQKLKSKTDIGGIEFKGVKKGALILFILNILYNNLYYNINYYIIYS